MVKNWMGKNNVDVFSEYRDKKTPIEYEMKPFAFKYNTPPWGTQSHSVLLGISSYQRAKNKKNKVLRLQSFSLQG